MADPYTTAQLRVRGSGRDVSRWEQQAAPSSSSIFSNSREDGGGSSRLGGARNVQALSSLATTSSAEMAFALEEPLSPHVLCFPLLLLCINFAVWLL